MNEVFLFPGTAPGSEGVEIEEKVFEEDWEHGLKKRIVSGVTRSSIIPFLPEKPNGAAVMVIPGGGYRRQVLNLEGTDIAEWLNSLGVAAFVLKHRMPFDGHLEGIHVPLQDAQRGMRLIRGNAARFGIEPGKIGVMGFSAGGHLAATLGTSFEKPVYNPVDDADLLSARPDFMILVYPEISLQVYTDQGYDLPRHLGNRQGILEEYPADQRITRDTPPAFLLVADDDRTTPAENSVGFYLGLRRAGVSAEMHIFRKGSHGFGLGNTRGRVAGWTHLCRGWLDEVIAVL